MKDPRTLGTKMKDPRTLAAQTTKAISTTNTAQANAYNTLLNATNVSTYNEMQPKIELPTPINTSAGDTVSLNTPKYQEIINKGKSNIIEGDLKDFKITGATAGDTLSETDLKREQANKEIYRNYSEKYINQINQQNEQAKNQGTFEERMKAEADLYSEYEKLYKQAKKENNLELMAKYSALMNNSEFAKEVGKLNYNAGKFGANYKYGSLGTDLNETVSNYLRYPYSPQNLENQQKIKQVEELMRLYAENAENYGKGGLITKDFASYAPQAVDQFTEGVKGALGGAVAGGAIGTAVTGGPGAGTVTGMVKGAQAGYAGNVAKYSYNQMLGGAYKDLIDLDVPPDIALKVATDTALWQSIIEGVGAGVDLATLGVGKLFSKGAKTGAQLTAKKMIQQALKAYGINIASEAAEEAIQEKIAIEGEKKALEQAGIERKSTNKEDWQRIGEAAGGGAKIALVTGGGNVIGNVTVNTINNATINSVNKQYDEYIDKVKQSNLTETQKQEMIADAENGRQDTMNAIQEQIEQTEGKKIVNLQDTVQNNTNIAETPPINEQISQNNVQNVSNLENTVQSEEIINSQEIKTKELQNAVQTYIEKTKNNFNTSINIPKIESTLNLKQESESTIYKKARDLFSNIKKKIFVNNGENIHVTNTDINESISKTVRNGYQKELMDVNVAVFSQLDKIIENGEKILENVPELKNRSKYQSWDYYATPIIYNGQKYVVEFDTVIRNDGEKHFRLERVFPLEQKEEPSMDVPTQKLTTPLPEGSSITNIIPNSQNYVNNQQINFPTQAQQQAEQAEARAKLPSTIITRENLELERDTKLKEIEDKIQEKQQILQSKKRQDTKVAENLKTQIENLNKRKDEVVTKYEEKIEDYEYQKRKLQDEIAIEQKELEEAKVAEILDDTGTKRNNIKELTQEAVSTFKRMFVDSGTDIAEIGKIANDENLYYMYNSAKQSGQSANYMISEAQTNLQGDVVGKSLTDIFEPIRQQGQDYYKDFEYYMYHLHNIDRMSLKQRALEELQAFEIENQDYAVLSNEELEQLAKKEIKEKSEMQIANEYLSLINKYEKTNNKPVFGKTVSSENSRTAVRNFEKEHPEFKQYAEDIRKWNANLQQFRVDTKLISQEQADLMNEMYPNYVPTYRETNGISGATKNDKAVSIVNTIKKAIGSNKNLLPLHEQMARQVMQTVQAGRRNVLGLQLYDDTIKNADKLGKYIQEIRDAKDNVDTETEFEFENQDLDGKFIVFNNGEKVEMQVSNGVLEGLKALSSSKLENNILAKGTKKINSTFKKLVTEWNPGFLVKNAVRDIQDAGFYSENAKEFYKNYPQAWKEITSNGEIWQKYLAMGGSDASLFDFEQGYIIPKDGIPNKIMDKIGEANFLVEQAPRFTEFLRIYNNSDRSYGSLMKAMYGAADITVNFGRSGTWGKFINNNLVPFFNPAIQGTSKTLRTITGDGNVKGAQNYAKHMANIVGKGVLLGVAPTMINHILLSVFGGDEYDDLNERDKDMYFLIPTGNGKYFKLPKGRVLSVIGGFSRRGLEYAKGDKDSYKGFGKFALEQTAPSNPFTNNIASPLINASFNTTWYGSPIESESMQNVRRSQRYDEGTTELAKGLGKVFNISPKKIDYVLDAYGGVVADVLMPLNTKKAETSGLGKSFILDSTYSNKLSTDFYDTIEELTYDKNDDDQVAKMQLKYMNDVKEKAQDINKQIKDLQASEMENKEKLERVKELRKEVNTLQRDALNTYEKYGEIVNKYLNDKTISELALRGAKEDITEESKQEKIDKIVKLYTDKEIFGSEYALKEYDKKLIEKQKESKLDADTFFEVYFAQKGVTGNKNKLTGKTQEGSEKQNKIQAMHKAVPKLTPWELNKLYELLN